MLGEKEWGKGTCRSCATSRGVSGADAERVMVAVQEAYYTEFAALCARRRRTKDSLHVAWQDGRENRDGAAGALNGYAAIVSMESLGEVREIIWTSVLGRA